MSGSDVGFVALPLKEKIFVISCIKERIKQEEKEQKKSKGGRGRKRR